MLKSAVVVRELQGQYDVQYEYGASLKTALAEFGLAYTTLLFRGFQASHTHQTRAITLSSRSRCDDNNTLELHDELFIAVPRFQLSENYPPALTQYHKTALCVQDFMMTLTFWLPTVSWSSVKQSQSM